MAALIELLNDPLIVVLVTFYYLMSKKDIRHIKELLTNHVTDTHKKMDKMESNTSKRLDKMEKDMKEGHARLEEDMKKGHARLEKDMKEGHALLAGRFDKQDERFDRLYDLLLQDKAKK